MERVSRSLARCQEQPAFSGWCLSYAARVRTPEVFVNSSVVYEKGAGQSARVRTIARVEPPWRHACRVANDERWQDTKKTSSSPRSPLSPHSPLSQNGQQSKSSHSYIRAAEVESLARVRLWTVNRLTHLRKGNARGRRRIRRSRLCVIRHLRHDAESRILMSATRLMLSACAA